MDTGGMVLVALGCIALNRFLEHHLKALRPPTILWDYASMGALCIQERCSYPQNLLRLVERELIDRVRRATARQKKEAQFPVLKSIASFGLQAQTSISTHNGRRRRSYW